MKYYHVCATQERGHVRASGCVTRKCMRVMRVRAWGCARVRVRMREGGSGWTGVCWRVISEGCGWRIGVGGWVEAGGPKVGGQCGPEREPKASAREGNERRVNRAGVGPVLTLPIFSPAGFWDYWAENFPLLDFEIRGGLVFGTCS
jgi:hypothetical protein